MSFDEQPDGDPHGECRAEIHRLYGAAENCWLYAARHRKEAWAAPILEFCKAVGLGSPLRSTENATDHHEAPRSNEKDQGAAVPAPEPLGVLPPLPEPAPFALIDGPYGSEMRVLSQSQEHNCAQYTAEQMQDYARAALRALPESNSSDLGVTLRGGAKTTGDRWQKWDGSYEKQAYDVWERDCDVTLACWPNAGRMNATDGSGRNWRPQDCVAVRVSEFQGYYPKLDQYLAEALGAPCPSSHGDSDD